MFLRRSVSLFLVGIGIGSPWLVRDWLATRSGGAGAPGSSWMERVRDTFRAPAEDPATDPPPREEAAERTPYPLASQTRRLVEGLFGASGGLDDFSRDSLPSTTRSRAIVGEVSQRLAPDLAKLQLKCGDPLVLRLFKEEGELEIWMKPSSEPHFILFKVSKLASASGLPGPKLREGDNQAPEGFYRIGAEGLRPETRHYLGLDFGYPNELDRSLGRTGSEMMIHAGATAAGSYALTPAAMDEVYTLAEASLRAGHGPVPVHLFPFRLTDKRMDQVVEEGSRWTETWVAMKEGYDFFENVRLPPVVGLDSGKYAFRMGRE